MERLSGLKACAAASVLLACAAQAEAVAPLLKPFPEAPTPPAATSTGEEDVDILIGGLPTKGNVVLPANDTSFQFKLKETGTVVTFRWSSLPEYERKRVQKMYGMDSADGKTGFGEKLQGVIVKLQSGKTIEGLPIPDRDQPGMMALRTSTAPLLMISRADIKSEEPVEKLESDFYSKREIYDRRLLEKPPGSNDAGAHLAMARWAASIDLYDKAIEHLEQAKIIDPRTEERNQDFRAELVKKYTNQQSQELFDHMLRDMRGNDYLSALEWLEQLDRTYKNSDLKSRWDALRPEIEAGSQMGINKKIVEMSYRVAYELLQKAVFNKIRIDDKGNKVPTKPGKQVTTRQGNIFRGVLASLGGVAVDNTNAPDEYEVKEGIAKAATAAPAPVKSSVNADDITLKMNDTTITIAGKDVLSIMDIDLAEGKGMAEANYDDLKDFVTDLNSPDGLKMQMCRKIARIVKKPTDDVKKIFDNRLAKEGKYEDGKLTLTNNYASTYEAFWGPGSWLRPGSKPVPYQKPNNNKNPNGSTNNRNGRYGGGGNNNNNNNNNRNNPNNPNNPPEEETSDETDDPAVWWKFQTKEIKLQVLKAMMAEKVFKAASVMNVGCPACAGKGHMPTSLQGGNDIPQRCASCRGIGVLYKIVYH